MGLPLHNILPVLLPALDFVSALEGGDMDQDHVSCPQRHCLALFIMISLMTLHLYLLKQVSLNVAPPNAVWMYFVEVGVVINFSVSLRVTSMGSWGCLPYIRKEELKPTVEFQEQLYTWTCTPIMPYLSDLHSEGSVPSILIRVELNFCTGHLSGDDTGWF